MHCTKYLSGLFPFTYCMYVSNNESQYMNMTVRVRQDACRFAMMEASRIVRALEISRALAANAKFAMPISM